jgi:hypothetical protein
MGCKSKAMSKPNPSAIKDTQENKEPAEDLRKLNSTQLARRIFSGDISTESLRALPAQSLYLAIQRHGIESCVELLELMTEAQYQSLLDFEFWTKDSFRDEKFWEWLSLINEDDSLDLFIQFMELVDPNVLGLIVSRYVESHITDEATDAAPGAGFYTPDNGHCWIRFHIEDKDRHALFGKFMAVIFQTKTELFYHLIAEAGARTSMEFEEEAYQIKRTHMLDIGIPDEETIAKIHTPIAASEIKRIFKADQESSTHYTDVSIDPLIYDGFSPQPLAGLVGELLEGDKGTEAEGQLSLISNASLFFFGVELSSFEDVQLHLHKVRGAINIGLESVLKTSEDVISVREIYDKLGFETLYRLGLHPLTNLKNKAANVLESQKSRLRKENQALLDLLEALSQRLPAIPDYITREGKVDEALLQAHSERQFVTLLPISYLAQIENLAELLAQEHLH